MSQFLIKTVFFIIGAFILRMNGMPSIPDIWIAITDATMSPQPSPSPITTQSSSPSPSDSEFSPPSPSPSSSPPDDLPPPYRPIPGLW